MRGSNAHRSRDCCESCRIRDKLHRGGGWIYARVAKHRQNCLRRMFGYLGLFTCEEAAMILYSKRTDIINSYIHPSVVYIYWDFNKCIGGHLNKERKIITLPNFYLSHFNDMDDFRRWRTRFKDYWEEPTTQILDDYLQVDEGL